MLQPLQRGFVQLFAERMKAKRMKKRTARQEEGKDEKYHKRKTIFYHNKHLVEERVNIIFINERGKRVEELWSGKSLIVDIEKIKLIIALFASPFALSCCPSTGW